MKINFQTRNHVLSLRLKMTGNSNFIKNRFKNRPYSNVSKN
jgi:hypothetical protein